ncbi:putative RING1 and YY1-binding protein [Scophthalmus maximus]|uniref:Putative RING1 and YY1-binding protein n=1 Tax=Scophthalmus maximus TaxID=52904 RepID=A0A2U9BIL2_SCOMX|nr:putative RING1 and YY1-binding protein [Scophthalmus maximus]
MEQDAALSQFGAAGGRGLQVQSPLFVSRLVKRRRQSQPRSAAMRLIHVCALDPLHRKPRINSQLVAQQVAQQYPMPPPPKKERRERSERTEKDRPDGEGERANGEGRPEGERPEGERPEGECPEEVDTPEKEKNDKEQPIKDKPDREKEIIPAVTKKPSNKKTRPKSDNHQSPPSDKHSIQSGKSATKTNKNSHISRPKLKNIDRSTAQQLAITVGNHQSSGSESMDKGSSRASTPKGDLSLGHDEGRDFTFPIAALPPFHKPPPDAERIWLAERNSDSAPVGETNALLGELLSWLHPRHIARRAGLQRVTPPNPPPTPKRPLR